MVDVAACVVGALSMLKSAGEAPRIGLGWLLGFGLVGCVKLPSAGLSMKLVVKQVDSVDVIVGSHVGPQPYGFLNEPWVVGRTILSVAVNDLAAVGQLDLVVRRNDGPIIRFGFRQHLVTSGGPTFLSVKAVLDRYLAKRSR